MYEVKMIHMIYDTVSYTRQMSIKKASGKCFNLLKTF